MIMVVFPGRMFIQKDAIWEEIHELPLLRPEEEFTQGRDPCVSKKKKKKKDLKAVI